MTTTRAAAAPDDTVGGGRVAPVYLVRGDDPSVIAQAAHALTTRLVDGGDPSLMVEEFGGSGVDQFDVGMVIDACTTPPFLVERRVVVVREAGRLGAEDARRLVAYLQAPLETTALVLVGGGGTVPASLAKVVASSGDVVDTSVGIGKARSRWLSDHLKGGPVRLDGQAAALLSSHLGGDMGRLEGLLATLASAYGTGATVSAADLEPFLGEAGALAPWDLTDAVDAGETATALVVLHRMLVAGDTHPLVVMGQLHRHYHQMLALDGAGVTSAEQAAQVLGLRSSFPAGKALAQSARLGSAGIARAFRLLAAADLDLRGVTDLTGETVLEVLVARLSRLARQSR